jgi:hypothetical protein
LKATLQTSLNFQEATATFFTEDAKETIRVICRRAHEKDKGVVKITVQNVQKPRSVGPGSQSAHFNGHVRQIAHFTGDDFEHLKYQIKFEAITKGWPYHYNSKGEQVPESESEVSTQEISFGIEQCHESAAFLGIRLVEGED